MARTPASANLLGNIQLLIDHKDFGKSDGNFPAWLRTRTQSFLWQHLIINEPKFCPSDAFPDFVKARGAPMPDALKRFLTVKEVRVGS
ncbi:hypothetical protein QCD71_10600 [Sphingomonas sp. PsM26]|nr:hypothetical protein [Sphingomonas sp. PsM26]